MVNQSGSFLPTFWETNSQSGQDFFSSYRKSGQKVLSCRCNILPPNATNAFVASKHSDRRARFDEVLEQYRGRLGKIALTYAGQESDDLLQEILLQIWRSLPTFEQRSSIGTWCYRIAINTAISWRRKADRKRIELSADSLDQHPSSQDSGGQEEAGLLKRFLATLGDVDQAVLLMHLENLNSTEIAESLGVSEGALRTRMSRLRQKLKTWDASDEPGNHNHISREVTTEVTDG